jgi:uncharacterized protein YggE
MPETVITVQGEFTAWYPAERATAYVTVQLDGAARDSVFAAANTSAGVVRDSITALHDAKAGPVTWWSSDSVRVWSDRPWNQNGEQLDLVYYSAIGFRVKFSDFGALAQWIEATASVAGASVTSIRWELTEATRNAVTTEVRSRSVKDAVTKATVFAQSIGLGSVTATALADPGMLGDQGAGAPSPMAELRMAKSFDADAGGALELKPEEIEVTSIVDARFVAR